ncbi:MAG: hypothetical protein HY554_04095 [Elusimicrobia bacterium]|nr:hypothetical protein [Elusimicrobiota bacterium]
MTAPVEVTQQCVVVARLGDFCRWSSAVSSYENDPWLYMRNKLRELEAPLALLKQQQLASARERFFQELGQAVPGEETLADYRSLFDRYLAPGDFVDVAFYLNAQDLADAGRRRMLREVLERAKAHSLFDEERKPEDRRSKSYEKLVGELWGRLGLDVLERALTRKPRTARRKTMALRRLRRNVAEYCSVLRVPLSADDTFSPFMIHRVEALTVACLRLLDRHR